VFASFQSEDFARAPQSREAAEGDDRAPDWLHQIVALAMTGDLETSIRQFLDRLSLSRTAGADVDPDRVSRLTFHATKGLSQRILLS